MIALTVEAGIFVLPYPITERIYDQNHPSSPDGRFRRTIGRLYLHLGGHVRRGLMLSFTPLVLFAINVYVAVLRGVL